MSVTNGIKASGAREHLSVVCVRGLYGHTPLLHAAAYVHRPITWTPFRHSSRVCLGWESTPGWLTHALRSHGPTHTTTAPLRWAVVLAVCKFSLTDYVAVTVCLKNKWTKQNLKYRIDERQPALQLASPEEGWACLAGTSWLTRLVNIQRNVNPKLWVKIPSGDITLTLCKKISDLNVFS